MRSSQERRTQREFSHKPRVYRLLLLALFALAGTLAPRDASCTELVLIQRSNGLSTPDMEEGRTEFEVADMNGDGHPDLVSVGDHGSPYFNSGQHGIMVWLGDGTGNWSVRQTGNFGYGGVGAGDLDSDGRLDVAWGIHHNMGPAGFGGELIGAALGDGTGSGWTPWGTGLATTGETWGMFATDLADFDLDGRLDVVSISFGGSNGIRVYRNLGDGTWSPAWILAGGSVQYTLETGDFDGDGNPDILASRAGGPVWFGDGAFGFTAVNAGIQSGTILAVERGDFDGDGRADIALSFSGAGVRVYGFDPTERIWQSASTGLPQTGSYELVRMGDLNGDGHGDVVVYRAPTGTVYLGDGTGTWTADATWTMPSPGTGSAMRIDGDVDHDGREDIVIAAVRSGFPFYRNQLRVYSPWSEPTLLECRVQTPRGGEAFVAGSIRKIAWAAAIPLEQGTADVDLHLSVSGADGPWLPVAIGLPDNGRYEWRVTGPVSDTCRLRVTVRTAHGMAMAISDTDFRILPGAAASVEDIGSPAPPGASGSPHGEEQPFRVLVSPNPVTNGALVSWSGEERVSGGTSEPMSLEIVAPDGRICDRLEPAAGAAAVYWERPARLPAGIYFLRLHGAENGGGEDRKVVARMVVLPR